MDERDRQLLKRAVDSARVGIAHFRGGGSNWRNDQKTVDATAKRVEDVGESLSRMSLEARAAMPDIDWKQAVGMRTHLAHNYANLDLDVLQDVIDNHLPRLITAIDAALAADETSRT